MEKNDHTARRIAMNSDLDVPTSERSSSSRDRGYDCTRSSRVKHCESAVRRTSKRESCVKELGNNNHTLERKR